MLFINVRDAFSVSLSGHDPDENEDLWEKNSIVVVDERSAHYSEEQRLPGETLAGIFENVFRDAGIAFKRV